MVKIVVRDLPLPVLPLFKAIQVAPAVSPTKLPWLAGSAPGGSPPASRSSSRAVLHQDSPPPGQSSSRAVLQQDSPPPGQSSTRTVLHQDSPPGSPLGWRAGGLIPPVRQPSSWTILQSSCRTVLQRAVLQQDSPPAGQSSSRTVLQLAGWRTVRGSTARQPSDWPFPPFPVN